jgi:hypothetical protein
MDMKNNGGAAFPTSHSPDYPNEIGGGMTLRDYFAAKVLGGLASAYHENWTAERVAEVAYELADRMLAEREK